MDLIGKEDLSTLISESAGKCVSLYMPSHHEAWKDMQQDPIRFKNLLKKAQEFLVKGGMRSPEATALLEPAHRILKYDFFREHPSEGLSLFISKDIFRHYWLPYNFQEAITVNDHFYLKPLLNVIASDGKFYLLCLSQNVIKLYEGTHYTMREVNINTIPRSLKDALRYEEYDNWANFKGTTNSLGREATLLKGTFTKGMPMAGHGVNVYSKKEEMLRYFRMVDRGMRDFIGIDKSPLVLAGVEYAIPIYRDANTTHNLLPDAVFGNTDDLTEKELHEKAWSIVLPHLQRAQEDAFSRFARLTGSPRRLASNDLKEILTAAYQGRVDTLFVAQGDQRWGLFTPETGALELHDQEESGDQDLCDYGVLHTFLNSGAIFLVPREKMPDLTPLAAIFRY